MNKDPIWQTILSTNLPSNQPLASQLQKDRWLLLNTQMLPDLHVWASQQKLISIWKDDQPRFRKYVYLCANQGATTVLDFHQYPPALEWLSGCFGLWVFALDRYLDHAIMGYLLQQNWSVEEKIAYLDSELAYISEPLYSLGGLTTQQACLAGMPYGQLEPSRRRSQWNGADGADYAGQLNDLMENHDTSIRKALIDIYQNFLLHARAGKNWLEPLHTNEKDQCLDQSFQHEHNCEFAVTTLTYEIATLLGSMRSEAMANFYFQLHRELPDLETYIDQSTPSIYMKANAALILALGTSEEEWKRWYPALSVSAKIVRLANDCATYDQDIQEGKVSSITIELAASGNSVSGQVTGTDQQQRTRAVDSIRNRIKRELQRLEEIIPSNQRNESSLSPLGRFILCTLAYCLQVYQSDDYTVPKNQTLRSTPDK